jgi:hypothetical protein
MIIGKETSKKVSRRISRLWENTSHVMESLQTIENRSIIVNTVFDVVRTSVFPTSLHNQKYGNR